jgi:integrase/recombinase XerD
MMTLKLENKPPETLRTYDKCLRKYEDFLSRRKLKNNADSMLDFLNYIVNTEKLKPNTVKLYMIILKRYFKFLEIPFPKVRLPNVPMGAPKFIEKDAFKKLYDATVDNPMLRCQLSVCYSCAMRIEELTTRKSIEVDLNKARVFVAGKTGPESDAWLPMTETTVRDARAYLLWRRDQGMPLLQDQDYFFHRTKDCKVPVSKATLSKQLYKLCDQVGIKRISWHKIRHSRATHLRQDDVKMEDIQALLRHKSIGTTLRYARTDTEKLREKLKGKDAFGDVV